MHRLTAWKEGTRRQRHNQHSDCRQSREPSYGADPYLQRYEGQSATGRQGEAAVYSPLFEGPIDDSARVLNRY